MENAITINFSKKYSSQMTYKMRGKPLKRQLIKNQIKYETSGCFQKKVARKKG